MFKGESVTQPLPEPRLEELVRSAPPLVASQYIPSGSKVLLHSYSWGIPGEPPRIFFRHPEELSGQVYFFNVAPGAHDDDFLDIKSELPEGPIEAVYTKREGDISLRQELCITSGPLTGTEFLSYQAQRKRKP